MLNLFKNLRKKFFTSNQTSRYVVYAIGEIALVMIGILLALQVNNWNTERQNRKAEREIIARLTEELGSEIEYLKAVQYSLELGEVIAIRITEDWQVNNPVLKDSLQYINDFLMTSRVSLWYNEPITWTQLIQTGDIKLLSDQILINKLHSYYSLTMKKAENFAKYPHTQITEARKLWSDAFMYEKFDGSFMGSELSVKAIKEIPNKRVYDYIWRNRKEYLPLYTNLAYIYRANQESIEEIIAKGQSVLKELEQSASSRS